MYTRLQETTYAGAELHAWSSPGFDWREVPAWKALLRARGRYLVRHGVWSVNHYDQWTRDNKGLKG